MVQTGLARVAAGDCAPLLRGRRLALLCNPTSVLPDLTHAIDLFRARFELRALFAPEHGVCAAAQDMIPVAGQAGAIPVHSLYGDSESSLSPTPAMLAGLDLLVYDIQDVGCRFYTYPWTLVRCMEACARAGVAVVVLDRPNPLGGLAVEGPGIDDGYRSFVGHLPVPIRHGLTVGELARHANAAIGADLTVVELRGWQRGLWYDQTGLPWVMPSPNMPALDTATVYPGECLLEGTEVSEGRGTTRPFEIAGAPWVDGERLARALAGDGPAGVRWRPLRFSPAFHKFAGRECGGVQAHVADRAAFRPVHAGVALLCALRRLWPDEFSWRTRRYEFVSDRPAIDLLAGSPRLRQAIDAGVSCADIVASWSAETAALAEAARPARLYPEAA